MRERRADGYKEGGKEIGRQEECLQGTCQEVFEEGSEKEVGLKRPPVEPGAFC
jgi:hypothetical protein